MILIFFIFISIETRICEANANSYPNTPPGGIGYYRVDDFSIQDFTINEIAFFQAVKSRIVCASMCKAHNKSGNLCNAWKLDNEVCLLAKVPYLVEYTQESQRMPFYVEHTNQALEVKCKGGDDCCSLENICKIGEGDCDVDEDCFGLGLICGTNNCIPNDALYDNTDDCCTRRCTVENPCVPGDGQCQFDEDCKDPEFNKCETVATCTSQTYFPLNEFPNNTDSSYSLPAHCCRRRCYPHEQCLINQKGCHDNNDCSSGLKCESGTCIDNNECDLYTDACDVDVDCVNIDLGYECHCKSGFEVQQSGSMKTHYIDDQGKKGDSCVDIDECDENDDECPNDSSCLNNPGSYDCECKSGYEIIVDPCPNDAKIVLNNRWLLTSPNYPQNYEKNHDCKWTFSVPIDSKIAIKFHSFKTQSKVSTGECKDELIVEDGSTKQNLCGLDVPNMIVSSSNELQLKFESNSGTHMEGFAATLIQVYPGEEIDSMDVSSINCLNTSTDTDICTNTAAFCESKWDQCVCQDINECTTGNHTCDLITSECINNDGGFTCNCLNKILSSGQLSGYREKDGACVDIDECTEDSSLCTCASCINTIGNYRCECPSSSSKRIKMCPDEARLNADSGKIQFRNSIPVPIEVPSGSTQECVWVITVPENQVVAYKVHDNNLAGKKSSGECGDGSYNYEFLDIRDGGTSSSTRLDIFCEQETSVIRYASGNQLYIKYRQYKYTNKKSFFTLSFATGSLTDDMIPGIDFKHESYCESNPSECFCKDFNECAQGTHTCTSNEHCQNIIGGFRCWPLPSSRSCDGAGIDDSERCCQPGYDSSGDRYSIYPSKTECEKFDGLCFLSDSCKSGLTCGNDGSCVEKLLPGDEDDGRFSRFYSFYNRCCVPTDYCPGSSNCYDCNELYP